MPTTRKLYDSIFKKILTLSSKAVINMINGLFNMFYDPENSTVSYHWTENVHDNQNSMTTTLADTILVINNSDAYHMETQMKKDDSIVFRVFSYGAGYADQTKEILQDEEGCQVYRIHFPEPCVIYLSNVPKSVPDTYSLQVGFVHTQNITYNVPVTKLTSCSVKEINNRKMIILIPFYILKLREKLRNKKARTPENIASLKSLIKTDIMGSIDKNVELGNITAEDGAQLYRFTQMLYTRLYSQFEETEEVTDMVEQSIITFVDVFQEEKARMEKRMAEMDKEIADKDKKLADKDNELAELRAEIARLKGSDK